ncbi:N-acetylgalactosaminyltransferase 7 isoform X2 [Xiphophorus maculatus]|uniref:Polypeptide N-acetylgalactosaminyltransferase n=1 Tax=Xiphophorus maculatus TaxID=8083 RepID=A0A3B5R0D5_XIPMA|nr:N-acetylgalactosaminyltransferase 7 isoform X2 [Xiphophorus maculatus]XP_027874158.1 N-acetylgalactosaminyltransferase 7 isoform X2 [Xiphophorus couchianus]XP_032419277.1 N-acetylgalactosaminyltransferase 7 isoform X2 [Xiphophorus hellerii]
MRLKVGFLLRSLLVIGTFLGLVVLWSSLSPKPSDDNPFRKKDDSFLPKGDLADQFKPVVPWPRVEGVEVDLNSIRLKHGGDNPQDAGQQPNQKQVIQQQYVTFKPDTHAYNSPVLKKGVLGNFEPKEPEPPGVPNGPGEGAKPFVLGPEYKDSVQASIKEFGFNMVASDMISLDRTISDIRHEECKYWNYDDRLLTSSVIIVFHNEGWSTLMRTVHSVIKRTARRYLAEIVLIDDFSNKAHLKERLEEYIKQWNGLVKLFRNDKREGLIQARSIGAKKATKGQVLIYLDAHCEVGINWYAPLVAPISKDRTVCTVPLIDYIDGNEYTMEPQQGGDEDGLARGAWDWSLLWKRVPLSQKEKATRKYTTEPYRSPAMAGGLFAIERDFFFELGLYDPGLQIWGGENFEISYKIWQCGGQLLFVPCSRVGHIYRLQGWQGNPPPAHVGSSPTLKNYVRVVEVWWDDYKDYFYASRPETLTLAYGDISELKRFREEHRCKSFKWFMEEIAYDIPLHYPLPPKNVEWGEIRGFETSYCIDSMGHTNGGNVEIGPCHRMGGNQLFRINEAKQLMQYDQCLTKGDNSAVIITHCERNQHTEWNYFKDLHRFTHVPTGKCLDRSDLLHKVFISDCDVSKSTQKWEMNNIVAV